MGSLQMPRTGVVSCQEWDFSVFDLLHDMVPVHISPNGACTTVCVPTLLRRVFEYKQLRTNASGFVMTGERARDV